LAAPPVRADERQLGIEAARRDRLGHRLVHRTGAGPARGGEPAEAQRHTDTVSGRIASEPAQRGRVALAGVRSDTGAVDAIRAQLEAREAMLAPGAAREATSAGRAREEAPDPLRLGYQVDRDRIIHTRAFRRLKHKTQVFVTPDSDHVVTRMTHTIEVQ